MNTSTQIEYDSDQTSAINALMAQNKKTGGNGKSGLEGLLIRTGIVKGEKGAASFMIGIAVVFFIVAGVLFYASNKSTKINPIGWNSHKQNISK